MNLVINNLRIKKAESKFVFVFGILICVLMAFFKESIFPEKYFFDSQTIQKIIEKPYKDEGDKSFTNTAIVYRKLHIDKVVVAPILAITFFLMGILVIFKKYKIDAISFLNFILIVAYSAIAMVYMSTYSKDFILFLIVIIPFIFLEKKHLLIWSVFALLYAYYFRSYWFITVPLFWTVKLFMARKPKLLLAFIPIFFFVISFVYNYIFGTSLSMIRYLTNLNRDAETAQTAIATYIKGSNFALEAANFFVSLLFLIVPIPLLLLGKPFYVILTILIVVFFYNFIKLYVKEYKNTEYTNIFSFIIAFILVQSLFEPDYGSFVRHLSPLYPLIFVCVAKNTLFLEAEE